MDTLGWAETPFLRPTLPPPVALSDAGSGSSLSSGAPGRGQLSLETTRTPWLWHWAEQFLDL